jgi:hypothetical protein
MNEENEMLNECMLTTFDNPYDPFEEFTLWDLYDRDKGYNTCSYLARITNITEDMSQKEEIEEIERAIDEIITLNPLGIYKKVCKKSAYNEGN